MVFSYLSMHQSPLQGGLVKPEQWAPHPELMIPLVWDGAKESEFLTSSLGDTDATALWTILGELCYTEEGNFNQNSKLLRSYVGEH